MRVPVAEVADTGLGACGTAGGGMEDAVWGGPGPVLAGKTGLWGGGALTLTKPFTSATVTDAADAAVDATTFGVGFSEEPCLSRALSRLWPLEPRLLLLLLLLFEAPVEKMHGN